MRSRPSGPAGTGAATRLASGCSAPQKSRADMARGVIEETCASASRRFAQVSSVVIEEAAYDPSLRFVLVAVGSVCRVSSCC